jgi:hypothetical protein
MNTIYPNIDDHVRNHLVGMGYSAVANYILPGMSSHLIGERPHSASAQKVKLFTTSRHQNEHITPHSHWFDLACMVLKGWVDNTMFRQCGTVPESDRYTASRLIYKGEPGRYEVRHIDEREYLQRASRYVEGQWYFMSHDEIHSIKFSKDAMVLIFEGDEKSNSTVILEPFVDGRKIPTFKVEDWMFQS